MTVDVEEHFQVSAFSSAIDRATWDSLPSRVGPNTERLLDLFDDASIKATFFILGWVAERQPDLALRVAERGHEIACHGYSHHLVHEQTPAQFLDDLVRTRKLLQDQSGQPVLGHRAASFSIDRRNLWALDVVAEAGFGYDSSLFPVVHDRYGMPGAPRRIHRLRTPRGDELVEVPPSTLGLWRWNLPVGGGGYLRLYPTAFTEWVIGRLNRQSMPAVVYVHPWELDPGQPRMRGPRLSRLRHYVNLKSTGAKLRKLLERYRFGSVQEVVANTDGLQVVALP